MKIWTQTNILRLHHHNSGRTNWFVAFERRLPTLRDISNYRKPVEYAVVPRPSRHISGDIERRRPSFHPSDAVHRMDSRSMSSSDALLGPRRMEVVYSHHNPSTHTVPLRA